MENLTIKRVAFFKLFSALTILSAKGNITDFNDWLNIEEYRLSLQELKEKEEKLHKAIVTKTGYGDYAKKVEEMQYKNIKMYSHTDSDLKAIDAFKTQIEEFNNSTITIPGFKIKKSILINLPEEALGCRQDLLPICGLNSDDASQKIEKKGK